MFYLSGLLSCFLYIYGALLAKSQPDILNPLCFYMRVFTVLKQRVSVLTRFKYILEPYKSMNEIQTTHFKQQKPNERPRNKQSNEHKANNCLHTTQPKKQI